MADNQKLATRDACSMETCVHPHAVTEEELRLRSLRYAQAIWMDEDLIRRALEMLEPVVRRDEATVGQKLWFRLLAEPTSFVIRCMISDIPEGRLLRSNNPFSVLLGETDVTDRRRTRLAAKRRLTVSGS